MKNALIIVNPCAGRMTIKTGLNAVLQTLSAADILPTVYYTRFRGDATRIVTEMGLRYDEIVCCGGDGTSNETMSGVLSLPEKRPIGYIPCGSTNDFASTIGLSLQPKAAAAAIAEGKTVKLDAGVFNNRFFSYVASFGAFSNVSYDTPQQSKNQLGHFAYVLAGARALGEIRPYEIEYECDDIRGSGKFVFGASSNTTSIGGIVDLKHNEVSLSDGLIELILLRDGRYSPETLWNIVTGNLQNDDSIVFLHGSHISIRSALPISYTLDGEYGGTMSEVNIRCMKEAVDLFCPGK